MELKDFIQMDLIHEINKQKSKETFGLKKSENLNAGNGEYSDMQGIDRDLYFKRIDSICNTLNDVEEKLKAITTTQEINPHINVNRGNFLKVFIKKCVRRMTWWFIQPIVVQQSWYNTLNTAICCELRDALCITKDMLMSITEDHVSRTKSYVGQNRYFEELGMRLSETVAMANDLDNYAKKLSDYELIISKLSERIKELESKVESDRLRISGHTDRIELMRDNISLTNEKVNIVKESMRLTVERIEQSMEAYEGRVKQSISLINELSTRVSGQQRDIDKLNYNLDTNNLVDYLKFENKYRGSEEEIKKRLQRYLKYFDAGETVLDMGCGRGELLQLLGGKQVHAIGVDLNNDFVTICRAKGLNVIKSDMFEYLTSVVDNSLEGICAIQVIEHLSQRALVDLTKLCFKKLAPGGKVIFETQNPMTIATLAYSFYVDLSHIRPVHPESLKYLFEETGFKILKVDFPEYSWVTEGTIPQISGTSDDSVFNEFNKKIEFLNNLLYGSTDYAVIAQKPVI